MPLEVAILTAISFTVALGFGIVAPDIPAFARHFGVSTASAAGVVSAFALLRVIGALRAGRLVDRFGEHRVMAVGITVVAASSALAGLSGSFVQLIILRGVGGLGSAMFSVSAQTLLLVSVPDVAARPGQRPVLGRVPGRRDHVVPRSAGSSRPGLCGRRSSSTAPCSSCPPSSPAAVLRDPPRPASPRRPAAVAVLPVMARRVAVAGLPCRGAVPTLPTAGRSLGVRSAIVPLFVIEALHERPPSGRASASPSSPRRQRRHVAARRAMGRPPRGRRLMLIAGCLGSAVGNGPVRAAAHRCAGTCSA